MAARFPRAYGLKQIVAMLRRSFMMMIILLTGPHTALRRVSICIQRAAVTGQVSPVSGSAKREHSADNFWPARRAEWAAVGNGQMGMPFGVYAPQLYAQGPADHRPIQCQIHALSEVHSRSASFRLRPAEAMNTTGCAREDFAKSRNIFRRPNR